MLESVPPQIGFCHEAHISAAQSSPPSHPRFPRSDGDERWRQGSLEPPSQGPSSSDGQRLQEVTDAPRQAFGPSRRIRKKAEFDREYPRVGPACEAAQEQVLMRLHEEIEFLIGLAQELEDEEAHALSVAREKAKFDPSDEGRLRHRYLVEARRDLSRSLEDTRKAVAEARRQAIEKAAESRTEPTPNEPKREQTAEVVQPLHAVHQDVAECATSDVSYDFVNFAITPPAPHPRA